jgi:glycerophosphoryl diester phosphodiesterase
LTADGHLVLNHDAKTNGWSEVLDCMNATRAQLEALSCTSKYAVQGDKLAFYEEVMDYFSKNHTDIVLFVEMKDTRQAAGDKAVELTKAYGMQDRVIYLSSNLSFDQYMFNTHRVPVLKNSASVYPRTDLKRALALSCIDLGSLPTDYFTQWKDADVDLMRMLRHRGIAYGPWTTGTAADTDTHFFLGYANFTTNVPHQCDKYLRFLKVDEMDNRITVTAVYYDGTTADVTAHAEFVPLEGNVSYRNGEVSGQGAYTFRLRTALPIHTDLTYFVYSLSMCR